MASLSFGDVARGNLRALVETIDREITRLPSSGDAGPVAGELRTSWDELVKQLALGPTPETRECPVCHGTGMRAASRCGHCWAKLEPLHTSAQGEMTAHAVRPEQALVVPLATAPVGDVATGAV